MNKNLIKMFKNSRRKVKEYINKATVFKHAQGCFFVTGCISLHLAKVFDLAKMFDGLIRKYLGSRD